MADYEPEVHCIRGMAVDISEITTANPTFSTMTDSLLTPPITVTLLSSSAQHRHCWNTKSRKHNFKTCCLHLVFHWNEINYTRWRSCTVLLSEVGLQTVSRAWLKM